MKTMPDRHSDVAINEDLLKQLAYNDKMAELGRISAGLVHELNAPLSVITSASQMILREENVNDSVREMIERINSEAHRLSRLTRTLLNFSSQEDSVGDVDLNLTVEFVLDFLHYEASKRGVVIRKSLDHDIPVIRKHENMVKQILINIVMNALQAMEELGGELAVRTKASAESILLSISDNGPGISPDALNRIFERNFTTKKPGSGTGLGLYITRNLVEQMGGNIQVASEAGKGTEFTIMFSVTD
jgi:signal transduction histidine kinase